MRKTPYRGNYKLLPEQHKSIANMYASGKFTVEYIAKTYDVTPRSIQRIAHKFGVARTQAEANKIVVPLKNYHRLPEEYKVKRKWLTRKQRYLIITSHPYCTLCGGRAEDGLRLEVDHIDENPSNNDETNLQVLCNLCNGGKSHAHRYK